MEHPSRHEINSYYLEIKKSIPDFRDVRGRKHDLAMAMTCFFFSLLRAPQKNNISSIYRRMVSDYASVSTDAAGVPHRLISYVQLKRLLQGLGKHRLEELAAKLPGMPPAVKEGVWEALDGKELRGSIDKASGAKRGEAVVLSVSHDGLRSEMIGFYNGAKESEKPVLLNWFLNKKEIKGSYTFDALHTSEELLKAVNVGGRYLAPVKQNQKLLLEDCLHTEKTLSPLFERAQDKKGNGRVEKRHAFFYILPENMLAPRWHGSGISTLMVMERYRYDTKTKKESTEKCYYVSNEVLGEETADELFEVARGHWAVETNNNARDVSFKEDGLKCKNASESRALACFVNAALNLLKINCTKLTVFLENLMFDKNMVYQIFKSIIFL